ncbi:hypothetical protein DM01DRAFT_1369226 [Hesseltinella vesiculosa]|uniref:Homologous-pairing protein 2 winged helix domain-containing protein n=1 Tax=Hesseltinella vesiculosa TaxID=101127 RepID=A0A1X2GX08_9FUNG|nr:hypothetical protein DM01DRAFT_1369226 [Hesseltinella vesiculosa]
MSKHVLLYLTKVGRPHNAYELCNLIQGKNTKNSMVRHLESLVESGKVVSKVFGKTTIYMAKQETATDIDTNQLDELIQAKSRLLAQAKNTTIQLQQNLKGAKAELTTEAAKKEINRLQDENAKLGQQIKDIKSGETQIITEQALYAADQELTTHRKLWRDRRQTFFQVMDEILTHPKVSRRSLLSAIDFHDDAVPFYKDPMTY